MRWSIKRTGNGVAEYYAGDLLTYFDRWTSNHKLASSFGDDRDASWLMQFMANGYNYTLVEAYRGW